MTIARRYFVTRIAVVWHGTDEIAQSITAFEGDEAHLLAHAAAQTLNATASCPHQWAVLDTGLAPWCIHCGIAQPPA